MKQLGVKNKVKNILSGFKENWPEWALLSVVLLLAYVIFLYADLTNTIDNSIIFARALYRGEFLHFYELSVEEATTNFAANYNLLIYLIFAIWNLPAYLMHKLLGGQGFSPAMTDTPFVNLWAKTLILLFALCVVFLVYKIVRFCGGTRERALLAVFLLLSSMLMFYPVFLTAQLDIIAMSFMLAGVYAHLKKKRLLFILFFMLAAPCKMFAILLALPLILLAEKNPLKAGGLWLSTMSLLILENLLFRGSVIHQYALDAQGRDAMNLILDSAVNLGKPIVFFLVCYVALTVYCYMKKNAGPQMVLWLCFFLWGTFIAFIKLNTYWVILAAPFAILAIVLSDRFLETNVLVETVGSFCYFLYVGAMGSNIIKDRYLVSRLLLPKIFPIADVSLLKYGNLGNFFIDKEWDVFSPLFSTVWVASLLILMLLTCPPLLSRLPLPERQKRQNAETGRESEPEAATGKPARWMLFSRVALLAMAGAVTVYAYTATTNPIAYSNIRNEAVVSDANLTNSGGEMVVSQELRFESAVKLDELILKFHNTDYHRRNMSLVTVELWDLAENRCIFTDSIGGSAIQDARDLSVSLKGTPVQPEKDYEIRLSGARGVLYYRGIENIYPYFVAEQDSSLEPVKINGEEAEGQLYFQIR